MSCAVPLGEVVRAAHPGKWGSVSPAEDFSSEQLFPSATACELRDLYIRNEERREFPRLPLNLPVQVRRIGGRIATQPAETRTVNISCGGVFFVIHRAFAPGVSLDLEIRMAPEPLGGASLRLFARARVVRLSPVGRAGRTGVAAVFDDIAFDPAPVPGH
ncbi:MAG: PilZ domain-containing protein [Candidatus Acidiferrales bacterium]